MGIFSAAQELVRLQGVSKTFPPPVAGAPGVTVLNGVDLSVHRGELVLVEGCSGSGKSTLLGLAGLLWRPTRGRVFFMGHEASADSSAFRNRLRRHHVGFIFQNYQLFERMPAWESIALPLRVRGWSGAECRSRAEELLAMLDLEGRADHRTEQLSGGEQQRIAVARALATDPDLLLADEPLSNADPRSAELILSLLSQVCRAGTGLLVASHDLRFRGSANQRLDLAHPALAANGEHR